MTTIAATLRSHSQARADRTARRLLDVGFDALVLARPLYLHDWQQLQPLLPRESVLAVELFTPLHRGLRPGQGCPFALGSLEPEQKRDAEKYGPSTITFADENGIRFVLLPGVELDTPGPRTPELDARGAAPVVRSDGAAEAGARLDSYLSTIDRLLTVADRYEVRLAITPTASPGRIPDAEQTEYCLSEFRGGPLCVWADTAEHAACVKRDEHASPPWKRFEACFASLEALRDGRCNVEGRRRGRTHVSPRSRLARLARTDLRVEAGAVVAGRPGSPARGGGARWRSRVLERPARTGEPGSPVRNDP